MKSPTILRYETLDQIEQGLVPRMLNSAIRRVLADVDERPTPEPRCVKLEIKFKPEVDKKNLTFRDRVQVEITVDDSLPRRGGHLLTGELKRGDERNLEFNPNSPDDPRQLTIHDIEDDEIETKKGAV